ncbi:class I SAM-dependent methyltransferase [Phreatobacter aquaticus]|uniref:Class I SAM-dependent methyltransferase n=1 Tax=Phreatobacter aquaticus TaxID=2570229 RepID=A0A4D7QPP9_9HYPH|nr:cyclopropane-fatty-acyl-phospholipid synthase family protein [Phreatobacter aquaticus]QCK87234.1 class I SAM-dependent methyltransferase [Phreatobacter aquaticus]
MTTGTERSAPFSSVIEVTRESLRMATAGLPLIVRQALKYPLDIRRGRLTVTLPDGRRLVFRGADDGPSAEVIIRDYRFARRLILDGDVGFAEAFIRNEWDSPDPAGFLYFFCANTEAVRRLTRFNPLARLVQRYRHWRNRNTKRQAKRNIVAHYDLGNAFYKAWLDPSMTYSSAYFGAGAADLPSAQHAKYRMLADQLQLKPGDHVLEIGCGWGGFAEVAARDYGARVTALTLSDEQHAFAVKRMAEAGLSDRVTIKLQDYRDETGTYDAIASIEMFEAVGKEYWPVYFSTLAGCLKPGGRAGVQVITLAEQLWADYLREIDFIRAYVFPGGMLPTASHMRDLAGQAGLKVDGETAFGGDYAATLKTWADRFTAVWPDLTHLGFDERFRRLWVYYLAYCEAGFRAGTIDVRQFIFAQR